VTLTFSHCNGFDGDVAAAVVGSGTESTE
jgi:hypothetical protein